MPYGFINRSKSAPCPICDHPDWCGIYPISDGMQFEICHRVLDGSDIMGTDGKFYVFDGYTCSGSSRYEEATQRLNRLDRIKTNDKWKKSEGTRRKLTVVNEVKVRDNAYLDKIYRYLLDLLVLDPVHYCSLLEDGWTAEMIEKHSIKSFPESDYIRYKFKNSFSHNMYRKNLARKIQEHFEKEFGKDVLLGVPGAYKDSKGDWTFAGAKGILFPEYDANGLLYRLRIRMDFMDVKKELKHPKNADAYYEDEDGVKHYLVPLKGFYTLKHGEKVWEKMSNGKYRNFSSYHQNEEKAKEGFDVNDYDGGCEAGNQIGVYYDYCRDNMAICFITEGEKKAIFANEKMHAPFISVPGVNSWRKLIEGEPGSRAIDILKKKGVFMFVIAYDADKAVNEAVLKNEKHVINAIKEEGFAVGVANWDMMLGKGIDDLLFGGHQPDYAFA